jgi:NCS2 family nucleobase:cation symporter-2
LLADSAAVAVSGLLGGMASDTSASNVALSRASGATSRYIGFSAGGLFVLLAFSPKITGLLSVMPAPVMGAILTFLVSIMVISGMQIILSAELDAARAFSVGIASVFGLSLDIVPGLYAGTPGWLQPLFESSLTLTTVIAVVLHQVLRLGPARATSASTKAPGRTI